MIPDWKKIMLYISMLAVGGLIIIIGGVFIVSST